LLSCLNTDIVGIGGRLLNAAGSIIVSTAGATVNRQPSTVVEPKAVEPSAAVESTSILENPKKCSA